MQPFAVGCYISLVAGSGARAKDNSSAGIIGQVYVAGYEVGMEMCFEHVFYGCAPLLCEQKVGLRIA